MTDIHPEALEYPLLADDELDSMAQSIAANGQRDPITLDQHGRVVDGRNRLEACRRAEIEPIFETIEFADEDAISDFILDRNVEKRSLSSGQKAMFRACNLARNGKRRNGRWVGWSRDDNLRQLSQDAGWRKLMEKAGLVLDVASRATALNDDRYMPYVNLPANVKTSVMTLDGAHKMAQEYSTKAALAEVALYAPLSEASGLLLQQLLDAKEASSIIPFIDGPLTKKYRDELNDAAKLATETATNIKKYVQQAEKRTATP